MSDIISTRDDLFGYLVIKGISEKDAYRITEAVRMGKGVNEAISKGYDKFLAYENKRKQEYDPMKEDEDYHDIYMREEHGILVAKEMYARGINIQNA